MLLSMGESASVPVMGAIEKYVSLAGVALSPQLDQHIDRLSEFYGPRHLGDLERSHAIAYSWFCISRRDAQTSSREFNASVNFEIDTLLRSISYLSARHFFPPKLLSRLFGPRPPNSFL